jgi:hypothetical protein
MLLKSQANNGRWEQTTWNEVRGSYFLHRLSCDDHTGVVNIGELTSQYMRMAGDIAEHLRLAVVW